jgi:hypothetical protein
MPTTYSWVISQLECYPQHEGHSDVVFTVHWRRQATDGSHMADVYGSQAVTLDLDAPFTPFAQITKSQVEGWLVDAMGAERVAELDAHLAEQIEAQVNPPVVTPPLPWA